MADQPVPIFLTVKETCTILRVSKANLYNIINRGDLRTIKLGGKRLIARKEIARLVAELAA